MTFARTPINQLFSFTMTHIMIPFLQLCTFLFNLHLHSHNSCWNKPFGLFTLDMKSNTFIFRYIYIFNLHLYFLLYLENLFEHMIINSITSSTTLISIDSKWIRTTFGKGYINKPWYNLPCLIISRCTLCTIRDQ